MKNIAVITADDFSAYTMHEKFCPNICQFAQQNCSFKNAHCNIPFCQPSRSVLMTGLYPQNNGSTEFCPIRENVLTLPKILQEHGFFTALIGKNIHHTPYSVYNWNHESNPPLKKYIQNIIKDVKSVIKREPYFILINIAYPHRPFLHGKDTNVPVPKFLANTPVIKKELADYYASVSMLDNVFSHLLSLLNDCRIIFTSDHGMSFPFVKGNCYHYSTHVPLIYNGIKKSYPHVVSHVDFMPTILELLGINCHKLDGRSYCKILMGENQEGFNCVYAQLNRMGAGPPIRIRSLITEKYSYVLNIDTDYPANFVDGWGWHDLIKSYKPPRLFKRNKEELIELSSNLDLSETATKLKTKMRTTLIKIMKSYYDPCLPQMRKYLTLA